MEVLTLQLGHYSNYVGGHFWNLQDELGAQAAAADADAGQRDEELAEMDFGRLHMELERRGSSAWRPRLVLLDKKGAMGAALGDADDQDVDRPSSSLAAHNLNPEDFSGTGLWDFGFVDCRQDSVPLHPFQEDLQREERYYASTRNKQHPRGTAMDVDDEEPAEEVLEEGDWGMQTSGQYDFRQTVRTWTDFLKIRVPASSVHELRTFHHEVAPFATYFDGLEVKRSEEAEDIVDKVRRQAEQCDQLDAIHTLVDSHDGFGGCAAGIVLPWVREEMPKCGTLIMAVQPELPHVDETPQASVEGTFTAHLDVEACAWISSAFTFASIVGDVGVDAWLPLAVPIWSAAGPPPSLQAGCFRRDSSYETSALIAASIETATLPYRLQGSLRPSQFLTTLAPNHRPTCGLLQAFPLPPQLPTEPGFPTEMLSSLSSSFFDLTGTKPLPGNPFTSLVLRGEQPRRLVSLCEELHPRARRSCFSHAAPLPLPLPFPQFFGREVSSSGRIGAPGSIGRGTSDEVMTVPSATHLHASAHAGKPLALSRMVSVLKAHRRSPWISAVQARYGLEIDEFREVLDLVSEHLECGAASGSDDEDGEQEVDFESD